VRDATVCMKEVEGFFFFNQDSRVCFGWSRENGLPN
jgi:hypothetical protein